MRWCEEYNFKPEAVSSVSLISTLTERGKTHLDYRKFQARLGSQQDSVATHIKKKSKTQKFEVLILLASHILNVLS